MSDAKSINLTLYANFATIVSFIIQIFILAFPLITNTLLLRITSCLLFTIFIFSSFWLKFKAPNIKPFWRKVFSIIFYIVPIFFFIWVGTWFGSSQSQNINKTIFPIEKASVQAFLYQGTEEETVGQGSGYMIVSSFLSNKDFYTSYQLDYELPKDGDAYTGIGLTFPEPQDLSRYNFIELNISFRDEEGRCKLSITDGFKGQNSVILGDGNIVSARREEQAILIPLKSYFSSIARKMVKEINLEVDSQFVTGINSFSISKIRFKK